MPRFFHPILKLLAASTHRELQQQLQFLKAENKILRSRLLGCRWTTNPENRWSTGHCSAWKIERYSCKFRTFSRHAPDVAFPSRRSSLIRTTCMDQFPTDKIAIDALRLNKNRARWRTGHVQHPHEEPDIGFGSP